MRYSIHQLDPETWQLRQGDENLGTFASGVALTGYDHALLKVADNNFLTIGTDGLLPEGFISPALAVSEKLPGGRDFTQTQWSWRDPHASLVPMFLQTKNDGHMGADLVGFFTELSMDGTTVVGRGRFYDTEEGRAARDLLLDGRPFGVSVDPSENVDVEIELDCTEYDAFGDCIDGEMSAIFKAYEIAGATMHPIQGFDKAQVLLDANAGEWDTQGTVDAEPVRASLSIPTTPPREWMTLPEPVHGAPFLDGLTGDDVLVEQLDSRGQIVGHACPLTIRDDGLVYGHLTYWGQCHVGNPWGPGMCASASPSATEYRDFHCGTVKCDDGTEVPTGRLVVGCEHSDAMDVIGVRDALAHAGLGWASVHVTDGEHGPWLCGVLEPTLTEAQVRMLRSLSLSGEWVGELGGILAVNASGLPVQRARLAASGMLGTVEHPFAIPQAKLSASVSGGTVRKLIGANLVRSCPECQKRRLAASAQPSMADVAQHLAQVLEGLRVLDLRTRHLVPAEAEAMMSRLSRTPTD